MGQLLLPLIIIGLIIICLDYLVLFMKKSRVQRENELIDKIMSYYEKAEMHDRADA